MGLQGKLFLENGLELRLFYPEASAPLFLAKPPGKRCEVWTHSVAHRTHYYRICRWPGRIKNGKFVGKLINKATSTQHIMDGTVAMIYSGRFSFDVGHA